MLVKNERGNKLYVIIKPVKSDHCQSSQMCPTLQTHQLIATDDGNNDKYNTDPQFPTSDNSSIRKFSANGV